MRSSPRTLFTVGMLLAGLLVLAPAVQAQVLGEIEGFVRADNGDPLPGVTVVVRNQETGAERIATTDATGFYRVRSLPSGVYSVTGSLEGMQTTRRADITLLLGQELDVDLTMGVEAQEEVLTVTADTPLVEVGRSSTASYITETEIENIPIVGRDFKQFALLAPTVTADPQRGFITMSGQRGVYSGLRVDGTSFKNAFFGYANGGEATENDGLVIAQESVKEFQVVTNGFAPEYGLDGGGFINVITKSGTNQLRGSAFYYFTDDSLAEDIPATPLDKLRDPDAQDREPSEFERENYGVTFGGPIKRDKVHWFVSWDQTDRGNPLIDRLSTRGAYDAILQRAETEPAFAALVEGYVPNNDGVAAPDPVNGRTATGQFERSVDNVILLGKLDFYPSQTQSGSFRYNYTDYERTSTFLDEESLKAEEVNSVVGSWVSVIGNAGLNDFRFQWATDDLTRSNLRVGTPIEAQIRFRFGDRDSVGKFDFLPIIADTEQFQIKDSYSYLFGEHDLKFGVDYSSDNMAQIFAGSKDGRYDFTSMENFLNNVASAVRIYFGDVTFPNYDETQDVWGIFAQDSWRPNDRLTVNYGLRYGKTDNPSGLEHVFDFAREIPDDDHISPRVGFTYQLDDRGDAVIRGGYGVFYGRTPTLLFASQVQENGIFPNFGRVVVVPGQAGFVPLGQSIDNENPPRDTVPSTSWLDPNFEDAKNTRFNVGYERRLGRVWSVGVDLLYAEGENLQRNFNDNVAVRTLDEFGRPLFFGDVVDPNFNTLFVRRSVGESEYQAATLKVTRRFADRFSFQAHYTWSEDKDDDSNERNATDVTVSNPDDPSYDWGLSHRDIENRFVAVGVASLPLGFKVAGTLTLQDGTPYTAMDPNVFGPGCPFDTALCPAPRAVIDGRLVGRNTFRNGSRDQVDVRFAWVGDWEGKGELEVFTEVFNLFDSHQFAVNNLFNRTLNPFDVTSQQQPQLRNGAPNPEFGVPDNRSQSSRFIQFGVRFRY